MRKKIKGVEYDTSKAVLVRTRQRGEFVNDFDYIDEALYRTPRSSRYFLAGSGGARTRWGVTTGDGGRIGGEGIIPLTNREAEVWLETGETY